MNTLYFIRGVNTTTVARLRSQNGDRIGIMNGKNIVLAELSPMLFDGSFNFGSDISVIGLVFIIVVWILTCCLWLCIPEKDDIPLIAKHAAIPSYVIHHQFNKAKQNTNKKQKKHKKT